jgi:hypothetical protein
MIWRFNDGTTAELGGKVEGASLFAQELREMLARDRVGVAFGRQPGGGAWLDTKDAALFDAWLRQEMARPYRRDRKLKLIDAPENIPALPEQESDDPDAPEPPDDAVF